VRIALDSAILVRANHRAEGVARALLAEILNRGHILILSASILEELEASFRYPRLIKRFGLRGPDVSDYLSALKMSSVMVEIDTTLTPPIRDIKDLHVVQAAIAGRAEYLCTLDRHFYDEAIGEFCARRGITIITDVDLIRLVRAAGGMQ
jgi:putative PIN family toxin of toxin-antitoxin system